MPEEVVPLLWAKGFAVGFAIAAPLGPTAILCIRRTLGHGRIYGFATGLGAAVADAVLGAVAAYGLMQLSRVGGFMPNHHVWLGVSGGLLLVVLGLLEWHGRPPKQSREVNGGGLFACFFVTLLVTLANPTTILSFAAVMAGLGVTGQGPGHLGADGDGIVAFIAGVLFGSLAWWWTLVLGVGLVRHRLGAGTLIWLNRISGSTLFAFGAYVLVFAFR
jgi:threonine/homoserine/homoserine lactone efflux protein